MGSHLGAERVKRPTTACSRAQNQGIRPIGQACQFGLGILRLELLAEEHQLPLELARSTKPCSLRVPMSSRAKGSSELQA